MTPIHVPQGTRLVLVERNADDHCWYVWTARSSCGRYGTRMVLHDDGLAVSITTRATEGDEWFVVKPRDGVE